MAFDSFKHHRQSYRLKSYDYSSQGAYFITITTHDREYVFGDIQNGKMELNGYGQILQEIWNHLPRYFPSIDLDEFIIMPNHIHGIISVGAPFMAPFHDMAPLIGINEGVIKDHGVMPDTGAINCAPTVGRVIRYFKAKTAYSIHQLDPSISVWQRNYYDRIIRTNRELEHVRQYIRDNPKNWGQDPEKSPP